MLQLSNTTPFITDIGIFPDKEGIDSVVAVIKATFDILPDRICVSKNQLPVIKADEYWGEPGKSSLKYASEITLPKPFTDIVMISHAYSSGKNPVYVSLMVGHYAKTVIVFGERYWNAALGIHSISDPRPFIKIPLIYENAFGGTDIYRSDANRMDYESKNPVGCGFKSKKGRKEIDGLRLPNIEDPQNLINSWRDRPVPAGFGYIAPSWESRIRFTGTYDLAWQKNRAPYLPKDFDYRFFNCAQPDLITREHLKGGEKIVIKNATPDETVAYRLPKIRFEFFFIIDGKLILREPDLDTLILEPDHNRFSVIWRTCQPCDKKILKIQTIGIQCIESDIDLGTNET